MPVFSVKSLDRCRSLYSRTLPLPSTPLPSTVGRTQKDPWRETYRGPRDRRSTRVTRSSRPTTDPRLPSIGNWPRSVWEKRKKERDLASRVISGVFGEEFWDGCVQAASTLRPRQNWTTVRFYSSSCFRILCVCVRTDCISTFRSCNFRGCARFGEEGEGPFKFFFKPNHSLFSHAHFRIPCVSGPGGDTYYSTSL